MMHPKFLLILLVALCCIYLTLGQESEYNSKRKWKNCKEGKNFDKMKCVENFFHCLTSSNRTIERFMEADKKCCAKTLNDSSDIWFVTFHMCVSWQTSRDVRYCIFKSGCGCRYRILEYFGKTFPDYLQFEKDMMDRIDPRPKTAEECDDSFLQSYGNAFKEQCKDNTDKNLDPMCNASRVYYQ
uniref:Putative secreted protein n=1 Tax=Centruroides hentzi TaxID=88313 RepID=A0A2I9LPR2_9SCOR